MPIGWFWLLRWCGLIWLWLPTKLLRHEWRNKGCMIFCNIHNSGTGPRPHLEPTVGLQSQRVWSALSTLVETWWDHVNFWSKYTPSDLIWDLSWMGWPKMDMLGRLYCTNTKISGISYIGILSVALWPDTHCGPCFGTTFLWGRLQTAPFQSMVWHWHF